MRRTLRLGLRAQLFLLFCAVAVPLGAMGIQEFVERRNRALADVQEEVGALAQNLTLGQEALIEGARQILDVLALLPEVQSADATACDDLLAHLLVRYPQYANLGVVELDGRVRCSALPAPAGTNLSDRRYFQQAVQTGAFSVGRYQVGRITGRASLNVASPVRGGANAVEAVVFAALDLRWIDASLSRASLPKDARVLVTDSAGTILVSFPTAPAWTGRPAYESPVFGRGWSTGSEKVTEVRGDDGVRRLLAHAEIQTPASGEPLHLAVAVPTSVAFVEVQRGLMRDAIPLVTLLAVLGFGLVLADNLFFRRLGRVVDTARAFGAGNLDARTGLRHTMDPVGELAGAIDEMAVSIAAKTARLRHQATHDPLTGLANHAELRERLQAAIGEARARAAHVSALAITVDRLDDVAATLGHPTAEAVLKKLAPALRDVVPDGVVARIRGEDFAALVPGDTDRAEEVARRMVERAQAGVPIDGLRLESGVTVGVATFPQHAEDADMLLQRADVAAAIARARDAEVAAYDPARDPYSKRRLALVGAMRHAFEADELFVLYQPKLDLRTRRPCGAEALVRWRSPAFGIVSPMEFVTLAETAGLIQPLTDHVLRAAFRQARVWERAGLGIRVSVNVSARSVVDPGLPDHIAQLLAESGASVDSVELELTETVFLGDPAAARMTLTRLHGMGFRIAVDDFGTGYSSLAYLRDLPVDVLKIDKSFVTCAERPLRDPAITRVIVELAHTLGLDAIAEGVDRRETLEALAALGCDEIQGDVLAPPSTPEAFEAWARSALAPA